MFQLCPQRAIDVRNSKVFVKASSSIGRASVSKTEGWGFETLLACQVSCMWQGILRANVETMGWRNADHCLEKVE